MPIPPVPVLMGLAVVWASGSVARPAAEPLIRVGVRVAEPVVRIAAESGAVLFDAGTGEEIGGFEPGETVEVRTDGGALLLSGTVAPRLRSVSTIRLEDRNGRSVEIDGTAFRGRFELLAVPGGGVTAVNIVHLEDYLLGVVPLEIGPRTPEEAAAVSAQAVAARTYAVAHLGGHAEIGFDLYGSVADQVYGGRDAERPEASEAVRSTAGRILTHGGLPIRAYYHSTCGGRTAAVDEVMDRSPAPYLRSVSDRAPDGTDWCSISPRYRWTQEWTAEELNGVVRDELARMFATEPAQLGRIDDLEVIDHTASGRVHSLAFRGPAADLILDRLDIRFALRDDEGRILGSTDFELIPGGAGSARLTGRGFGHGAGMCQWGAIARARAGQSVEQILGTYYPGAALSRIY
ncbi:MAG: SpoIID/LytB domain-containing protein [marine benthic group bacterium]|nr:SpoIID/LytB domain-containing protein [Gemmatimonadota bacterium]